MPADVGVRLQTSISPSNSRAMNVVGNLDESMGGFPVTDGPNLNLAEREKVKAWQAPSAWELTWIKKGRGSEQKSPAWAGIMLFT